MTKMSRRCPTKWVAEAVHGLVLAEVAVLLVSLLLWRLTDRSQVHLLCRCYRVILFAPPFGPGLDAILAVCSSWRRPSAALPSVGFSALATAIAFSPLLLFACNTKGFERLVVPTGRRVSGPSRPSARAAAGERESKRTASCPRTARALTRRLVRSTSNAAWLVLWLLTARELLFFASPDAVVSNLATATPVGQYFVVPAWRAARALRRVGAALARAPARRRRLPQGAADNTPALDAAPCALLRLPSHLLATVLSRLDAASLVCLSSASRVCRAASRAALASLPSLDLDAVRDAPARVTPAALRSLCARTGGGALRALSFRTVPLPVEDVLAALAAAPLLEELSTCMAMPSVPDSALRRAIRERELVLLLLALAPSPITG